jgi:hypothetical protein
VAGTQGEHQEAEVRPYIGEEKYCQHRNAYERIPRLVVIIVGWHDLRLTIVCVVAAEFRSYFEHVRALRFDDRPDYDYLKRLFRELFFRKGFSYDNMYDWEIMAQRGEDGGKRAIMDDGGLGDPHGMGPAGGATADEYEEDNNNAVPSAGGAGYSRSNTATGK